MAKRLQLRGGTTAEHSTFTGALREVTVDTNKNTTVVHDGSTPGGFPLAKETGDSTNVFKIADAVDNDDAFAKGQFSGYFSGQFSTEMNDYKTVTPILSGNSSGNENTDLEVTITNYDANATYYIEGNGNIVNRVDDVITVTLQDVDEDLASSIDVYAVKAGELTSVTATHNFDIIYVTIDDETGGIGQAGTMTYENTTMISDNFNSITNGSVTDNEIIGSGGTITATTTAVNQDDEQADFHSLRDNDAKFTVTDVLGSADATDVTVTGDVSNGDKFYVGNDTEFDEVTVADAIVSDVDTHDFFGDGSAVATYQLNGNATDLGGNYDLDYNNTESTYEDFKFGKGLNFQSNSVNDAIEYSDDDFPDYKTLSFWVNLNAHDDDDNRVFAYNFKRQEYSDTRVATSEGIISLGKLHPENEIIHVVCTITDENILNVYHNNGLWVSKSVPDNTFMSERIIEASDAGSFNGTLIDQIRVFNRALTEDEITALYNEQAGDYKITENYAQLDAIGTDPRSVQYKLTMPTGTDKCNRIFGDLWHS